MKRSKKQHILHELAGSKDQLFSKYGIKEMAIFGSVSRDDNTDKSDLDVLVDFDRPIGIEFIDLADELEALLNVKIDLVSKGGLKEKYFRAIEKDLAYV
jgi:predicted nucleotidyltransferase